MARPARLRLRAARWACMRIATAACGSTIMATDFFTSRRTGNTSGSRPRTTCPATAWARGSKAATAASGSGMDHGGLARLRDRRFHVIGTAEGLPARTALSVCEDANGAVWIGTGGRRIMPLEQRENHPLSGRRQRVGEFCVFDFSARRTAALWLSAAEGEDLYQFHDGRCSARRGKCMASNPF